MPSVFSALGFHQVLELSAGQTHEKTEDIPGNEDRE